jgi:hypothetical protein
VCVDGVTEVAGIKVFVLHMIQARDPGLVGSPFFARFDPGACWLTDLVPVFADRFPFEPARYETVPDELPGLFPREPDEPGGARRDLAGSPSACLALAKTDHLKVPAAREQRPYLTATVAAGYRGVISTANAAQAPGEAGP